MYTLSVLQLIIGVVVSGTTAAGITYYLVTLQGNAEINCDTSYSDGAQIGLNPAIAKTMINTYVQNHQGEPCSAWFSLQSIQKFACMIENNAKNNCQVTDPTKLGIRVYFATYPDAKSSAWVPSSNGPAMLSGDDASSTNAATSFQYAGMNTLVLVPTYDAVPGIHTDFDPSQVQAGSSTPIPMSQICTTPNPPNALMMNHGGMIPPPWPGDPKLAGPSPYFNLFGAYFLDI